MAEEGVRSGVTVDDVLAKPVAKHQLLSVLRRLGSPPEGASILVVDDDPSALRLAKATIEQLGYRAVCVGDGATALKSIESHRPALVVVDLLMTKMNGFELVERIRNLPQCEQLPVFVWSGMDLAPQERAALGRSAAEFVLKGDGGVDSLVREIHRRIGVDGDLGRPATSGLMQGAPGAR